MSEAKYLTRIYQRVFGEDILKAVVAYEGKYQDFGADGSLPTHGSVTLEFRNGRRVRISTSEWGGACDADSDEGVKAA